LQKQTELDKNEEILAKLEEFKNQMILQSTKVDEIRKLEQTV
jgi:hypothetical protein